MAVDDPRQHESRTGAHMFCDCPLTGSELSHLGLCDTIVANRSCFRSWELDVQKTSSLQLIYCLPWRGRNSKRSVWGSPWTQVPWPLRTYQCELFRKQRQKTSLASFLLFLMFHYLLPETQSNHELCHPATSIIYTDLKKSGNGEKPMWTNTTRAARLGSESLGAFLLPAAWLGIVSSSESGYSDN